MGQTGHFCWRAARMAILTRAYQKLRCAITCSASILEHSKKSVTKKETRNGCRKVSVSGIERTCWPMKRWEWFGIGALALSTMLTGCGSATSAGVTPNHQAQTGTYSNTHAPVHITVQQKQGHLTVQIATPKGVSAPEAAKLQNEVQQLNQLLQQLQNP